MPPQPPGYQPPGAQPPGQPPQPPGFPPGGPPQQPPSYPGAYQSSTPPGGGFYPPGGYAAAPVRRRTGWLIFAQVIVIFEASLFLLLALGVIAAGVYVLGHGDDVNSAFGNVSGFQPINVHIGGIAILVVGAVIAVLALLWLILGVTVGRPSNVSRWIIVVFVILAVIGELSSLVNRYAAGAVVAPIVLLAVNALILYALLIDPDTRRAFAARP